MTTLELPSPPSFDYQSEGPWLISHEYTTKLDKWVLWTVEAAVAKFFLHHSRTAPLRRVVVDARGVVILGMNPSGTPSMVGTREVIDALFSITRTMEVPEDVAFDLIALAEALSSMGGVSLG